MNARLLNRGTLGHWTPTHMSAAFGHLGVVKLLLERGADILYSGSIARVEQG